MTKPLPDSIVSRIRQFTSELCIELNESGFRCRGNFPDSGLLQLLKEQFGDWLWVAAREQEKVRTEARFRYIADHGLLTREEAIEKLGLTKKEWSVVERFKILLPVQLPDGIVDEQYKDSLYHAYYSPDIALSDKDRTLINKHTFLNRTQAIARLRTSPHIFNKLRYSGEIQEIDGQYRQSDVDELLNHPDLFARRQRRK